MGEKVCWNASSEGGGWGVGGEGEVGGGEGVRGTMSSPSPYPLLFKALTGRQPLYPSLPLTTLLTCTGKRIRLVNNGLIILWTLEVIELEEQSGVL